MNFKSFIYFCALCGAWAAFFAWAVAEITQTTHIQTISHEKIILKATLISAFLGILLAGVIGFLDALMNTTGVTRFLRTFVCMVTGLVGSTIGGAVGQWLALNMLGDLVGVVVGWVIVGVTIGASIGIYDWLNALRLGKGQGQAIRKIINGIIGGTLGGALGGFLNASLNMEAVAVVKKEVPRFVLATGLVILGACIGLLIGLAQVILKEAWVRVEQGFRAGRQMILTKPDTTVGRAEGMDIALFGDQQCEKLHAHIVRKGDRYVLVDHNTPGGTYLNGSRISGQAPLKTGDMIGVGKSLLRFEERAKR
jgi:hypothetical protein